MRKSSKLLAVLLTLCLMFGAITAIFVSADGEAKDPYDVTENDANDYVSELTLADGGNAYYVHGAKNPAYGDGSLDIKNFTYITVDFDLSIKEGTDPSNNTSDVLANHRVSFLNQLTYYNEDGTYNNVKTGGGSYLYWNNGDYYIGSTSAKAPKGDLSTNGAYDHFTFVLKYENLDGIGYGLSQNLYINGQVISQKIASLPHKSENRLSDYAIYAGLAINNCAGSNISIKNVAVNHYTADDADLSKYAKYNSTSMLYDSDDVVYNVNYVIPGSNSYTELSTGEKFGIPATAAIGKKITNGATITVSGMNLTGVEIPAGVNIFTVVEKDGGSFTLSDMSAARFEKNGNVYTKKQISLTHDFNDKNGTYSISSTTGTTDSGIAHNNGAKTVYIDVTYNSSYARIHYQQGTLKTAFDQVAEGTFNYDKGYMEREAEVSWRAHTKYDASTEISTQNYMTIDLDFGADAYAYTFTVGEGDSAKKYYATALTEAEAVAKVNAEWGANTLTAGNYSVADPELALPLDADGALQLRMQFVMGDREAGTTLSALPVSTNINWYWLANSVFVRKLSDGNWYLCSSGLADDPGKTVKLSGEVGVFDHITLVYEVAQEGETTVLTPHIYVNGDYAYSTSKMSGTFTDSFTSKTEQGDGLVHDAKYHHFQQIMLIFGKNNTGTEVLDKPGYKMQDRYSIALDNMTVTYYGETDLAKTTLDESIESKAPLYTLDGVVYNENYAVSPNTGYAVVDGKTYKVLGAAFQNAEGKTINFYDGAVYYYTYYRAYNSFTVVCDDDSKFGMAENTGWRYAKDGDNYFKVFEGQPLANLSLTSGRFEFNIYLPIGSAFSKDAITFGAAYAPNGAVDTNFKSANTSTFKYNGVDYFVITWFARTDMADAKVAKFALQYTDADEDVLGFAGRFNATFDPIDYMTLAAEQAECGSEEAQLIKAMMDYKVACMNYMKDDAEYNAAESVSSIKAFYELYEGHETCCGTYQPEADYINVGAKHDNVTLPDGVQVAIGDSKKQNVYFIFEAETNTVFEVSYTNYRGIKVTNEYVSNEDGIALISGMKMCDIDNEFTVVVYEGSLDEQNNVIKGEQLGSFSYSIADYDVSTIDARAAAYVQAVKNLAIVAENYKKVVK